MKSRLAAVVAALLLVCTPGPAVHAQSADIIVFGDSWANRLSLPLLGSIFVAGFDDTTLLNAAFEGERADNLASNDPSFGLPYVGDVLAANPDTRLIHLSIGGNDLFDGILFINNDAIVNSLLNRVVGDTETIVREILRLRPDAEIYHTGYDFLRPILFFSPARVNEVMLDLDARLTALADTIPGYTYEGFYGFAQLTFGIPELGIPPGDPSLPRLDQPSPESTFVDEIHYTVAVYRVMADDLVDRFYASRLGTECLADVNGDGNVDGGDFFAWVAAFGAGDPAAEQNGDGVIDSGDFFAWIVNFNEGC